MSDSDPQLASATRTFGGLTLASRVFGLGRDVMLARIFGDTAVGSVFLAAFAIPNLFRRLFGEGALSAAFLPEYTRLERDDRDGPELGRADAFAARTIRVLVLVTGLITIALEVVLLVAIGAGGGLSVRLTALLLPFMPLVCTAALLGGMLQVHGRFAPSAAMPIVLNVAMILASIPFAIDPTGREVTASYVVGGAVLIAGVAQILWALWSLRGLVHWGADTTRARDQVRAMLKRFVPVLIGMGTLQLNAVLDMVIAMYPNWVGPTFMGREFPLDPSSNAVLSLTQRLYQFPLGVFGIAVATAVFPLLSRADESSFAGMLRQGLRLSLFIAVPASLGLALVRDDCVRVMYGHGFSEEGLSRSSTVLLCYAVAIWAYSINQVLTRAFYAKDDTKTPMRIAIAMVGFNLCCNVVLIWVLREAGLALSTALSAMMQCTVLAWILSRRLRGGIFVREIVGSTARIVACTGCMGGAVVLIGLVPIEGERFGASLLRLLLATGTGGVVYALAAWGMRVPELRWLLSRRTSA